MELPRQEMGPKQALRAGHTSTHAHETTLSPEAYISSAKNDVKWPSGMVSEATGWDVYNTEAKKVDSELIKDWNASLNFLLLFAAIFAAVLSAFIIESKKLLEPDPAYIMVDVLIFYTNSAANGTHTPYHLDEFYPTAEAITINCLLFGSLSLSIAAALGSVLALQWVADYDAAITRGGSCPEDQAKRRQFRFGGVNNWRMSEIIAALPLFLHLSVVLFFAGVIQWMRTLSTTVGNVLLAGAAIAAVFYLSTTLLAVSFVSAPFNTPLSRGMESLLQLPTVLEHFYAHLLSQIRSDTKPNTRIYIQPPKREDMIIRSNTKLASQALTWVTTVINVSPNSYWRLFLLVGDLLRLPSAKDWSEVLLSVSWIHIIDDLARKHLNKSTNATVTEEDIQEVSILMKVFENKQIQVTPSNYRSEEHEVFRGDVDRSTNGAFLLLHGLPSPSVVGMCNLILLSRWRYSGRTPLMWTTILDRYREEPALPHKYLYPDSPEKIAHPAGTLTILVDYFCKYIEKAKTSSDYAVESVFSRFLDLGLTNEVTFEAACTLVRAFEFYLTGTKIQGPLEGICSNLDLYSSLLEERHINNHYKLLKLLVKSIELAPEADQGQYAREIIAMLWSGPYRSNESWKDACRSDEIPIANEASTSASETKDNIYVFRILRRLALDMRDMIGPPKDYHLYYPVNSFKPEEVEHLIEQIHSELTCRGFETSDLGLEPPQGRQATRQTARQEIHTDGAAVLSDIRLICFISRGVDFYAQNQHNLRALELEQEYQQGLPAPMAIKFY